MRNLQTHSCCTPGRKGSSGCVQITHGGATKHVTSDMIYLPGGDFLMGTDSNEGFPDDGEGPVHKVTLKPFYIDACTVTNAEFRLFVQET
ncbi:MAG: formylglycine-generating enzyme family protein, partial [Alicyclobacillus shizuokensis]|nr:formylglycine-generating enzyme family protein [Alicyclobacillus shizuokensis]